MDKLKSEHDRLCSWLSEDPEYILDQSGDVLSMNEFREVQKQKSDLDKMRLLLRIILHKGETTCESFVGILKQHQAHYPKLQQFFNPRPQGSDMAGVFADGGSVMTKRELTDVTAKSLSFDIETCSNPGSHSSKNVAPHAAYTALGSSVICADKFSGVNIGGNFNYSVRVTPSKSDTVDGPPPSPEGPEGKRITERKVELIECLSADLFILQHMQPNCIVTKRQYDNLKHTSNPEQTVTNLIDLVIGKGEETCVKFLQVLKDPKVLETYPKLKEILNIES